MIQFTHQEITSVTKKIQIKKRTSSANFNTKKIKTILTTRQTCDQIALSKQKQSQLPPRGESKTLNYHRKGKSYVQSYTKSGDVKKLPNKALMEIIKPIKYEKSKEENFLLKNCDKSKLIYWSKNLKLQGREKYLILSADLLIDQDCFWDKISTDNGHNTFNIHNSNNFTSFKYNSTTLSRNRNINLPLPPKFMPLNSNGGSNFQKQNKRNPLMNPNRVNFLIREWKNLHNKVDTQNRKLVILWLIRKQSMYEHLVEFSQIYQLPLHGIFYVKRKRTNSVFDLGFIVKEIHQKFFQSIVNPSFNAHAQKQSPKTLKSIEKNTDFKLSKSKELKRFVNKQYSDVSIDLKSNIKGSLMSHKFIKSTKQTLLLENDQNCAQNMNLQTCKQFQLSKNVNKKPLVSIMMDEKRVKKIVKKLPGGSQVIKNRPLGAQKLSKRYFSPLITEDQNHNHNYNHNQQIQQLQEDLMLQMIDEEKQQQNYAPYFMNKTKYLRPQIYVFEGLKCNLKDNCGIQTYNGKIPLMLGYHEEKFNEIVKKLSSQGIQIEQEDKLNGYNLKMLYIRYETLRENALERVNSLVKEVILAKSCQLQKNTHCCSLSSANNLLQYLQSTIQYLLKQFYQYSKSQQKQPSTSSTSSQTFQQQQPTTLTQQQQQFLQQKTQKRLEQIKKQLINDVINMKGRNYTFQNGQSVYYYVGGVFKRNYQLLYNQYYAKFESQLITGAGGKGNSINNTNNSGQSSPKGNNDKINNAQGQDTTTNSVELPKLSSIQFFTVNNINN